jgi:hypothetical protein
LTGISPNAAEACQKCIRCCITPEDADEQYTTGSAAMVLLLLLLQYVVCSLCDVPSYTSWSLEHLHCITSTCSR